MTTQTKPKPYYKTPNTYKVLPKNPTSQLKNKLISLLKDIKANRRPQHSQVHSYTPPVQSPLNSMAFPKFIKQVHPLGPLSPVGGPITYGVAKEHTHIIQPLVGQSPNHLKNTQHFIQQLQGKKLEPGEVITSFDVKALFNSVSVHPAIQIVQTKVTARQHPSTKNQHVHTTNHLPTGALPHQYILSLPG